MLKVIVVISAFIVIAATFVTAMAVLAIGAAVFEFVYRYFTGRRA